MPATLDPNVLVDGLVVDVIDGLREDLHPQFGVRAYRVFTVRRRYSGEIPGEGTLVSEVETEIRPQPLVAVWDGLRFVVEGCGLDVSGKIRLTEVSLQLAESDLTGKPLAANEAWFIKLTEANGQGTTPRLYTLDKPPFIDRIKDMGWVLWLNEVAS